MIVLGIDTAIRTTGYGVIEMTSVSTIRVLDCGVIKNPPKLLHSECMRRIAGGIRELITQFSPNAVSIEDVFVQKNVRTAMILSLARGAAITASAEAEIPVFAYAPTKVKKAIFGSGMATKEQMALVLSAMFKIDTRHIALDATDALSMAICHAQNHFRPQGVSLMAKQV